MNALVKKDQKAISTWLLLCIALVTVMVAVGGYTRLSGSGLSITQWKPVHGVIPPLDDSDWWAEYQSYRLTPQFEKVNRDMTLDEFKAIFWPEYSHRLLGRLAGMVFFLPWLAFALHRSFSFSFGVRMLGIFALGGLQGVIGWIMVKSGLVDSPYVNPLKLALHLSVAFALGGFLIWALLDIKKTPSSKISAPRPYIWWFALLCFQIVFGALVAGSHAGLMYNTWPTMNGQWVPSEIFAGGPWHENLTLIQFIHRTLAIVVAGGFLLWWYLQRTYVKNNHLGKVCCGVAAILAIQFLLGVMTLLHQVPLPLALAHQLTAFALFLLSVILLHGLKSR